MRQRQSKRKKNKKRRRRRPNPQSRPTLVAIAALPHVPSTPPHDPIPSCLRQSAVFPTHADDAAPPLPTPAPSSVFLTPPYRQRRPDSVATRGRAYSVITIQSWRLGGKVAILASAADPHCHCGRCYGDICRLNGTCWSSQVWGDLHSNRRGSEDEATFGHAVK